MNKYKIEIFVEATPDQLSSLLFNLSMKAIPDSGIDESVVMSEVVKDEDE